MRGVTDGFCPSFSFRVVLIEKGLRELQERRRLCFVFFVFFSEIQGEFPYFFGALFYHEVMFDFVFHAMKLLPLLVRDHVLGRGEIVVVLLSADVVVSFFVFVEGVVGLVGTGSIGRCF